MVEMKYAIITAALTAGLGYYFAFSRVNNGMCKDPTFMSNMGTIQANCPNVSTLDLIKYYERFGAYSGIPK